MKRRKKDFIETVQEQQEDVRDDLILKRYYELSGQAKAIKKALEGLRKTLLHKGTHSTSHFVCSVTKRTEFRSLSKEEIVAKFGEDLAWLYLKETERTFVRVEPKGGQDENT